MSLQHNAVAVIEAFVLKYSRLPTERDPDYLEMLRMSKYRVLAVPDFSPGNCANCGASKNDGRKYVDFGLQIEWYGTVYLCGDCLHDISDTMGLFEKQNEKVLHLEERLATMEEIHSRGEALHELVNRTHEEFEKYYAPDVSIISDGPDISSPASVEPDSPAADELGTNETKSGVVKPASSPRSKNVRSLTDLLNN
jgi:hypothetical protein